MGMFKGLDFAISSAIIRAGLSLPLYDTIKTTFGTSEKEGGFLNNFN
jgi:hypothetical protein